MAKDKLTERGANFDEVEYKVENINLDDEKAKTKAKILEIKMFINDKKDAINNAKKSSLETKISELETKLDNPSITASDLKNLTNNLENEFNKVKPIVEKRAKYLPEINKSVSLNEKQKATLIKRLLTKTTVDEIEAFNINDINNLINSMKELKEEIESLKDSDFKTGLDAKDIKKLDEKISEIENKIENVDLNILQIQGHSENLSLLEQQLIAIKEILTKNNLSTGQKDSLRFRINSLNSLDDLDNKIKLINDLANELNEKMPKLKEAKEKLDKFINENSSTLSNGEKTKLEALKTKIENRIGVILDIAELTNLIIEVDIEIDNVVSFDKLKENTIKSIKNDFSNLSNKQKEMLENKANSFTKKDELLTFKENASKLNAEMEKLFDKVAEVEKSSVFNTNDELKTLLDKAKNNLETIKVSEITKLINDIDTKFKEVKDKANLIENKNKVKDEIDKLTSLSNEQKQKYKDEIDKAETNKDKANDIKQEAVKLNNEIKKLDDKIKELEKFVSDNANLEQAKKDEANTLIARINTEKVKKELKHDKVSDLIKEIENKLENLKKINKTVLNDPKYLSIADAFYYENTDIINNLNEKVFFNINFNSSVLPKEKYNFITGLTLGGSYELKKLPLSIGGFVEYNNKKSHHTGVGATVKYKGFKSFVRYRLALLKNDNLLINHNVDLYARYGHNFKINKFNIEPALSLYTTYSSKVEIDDKVTLKDRIGADLNLSSKFSYDIYNNLNIYATPRVSVSYNNQLLLDKNNDDNKHAIVRSLFKVGLKLGTKYKVNNFSITPEINFDGDIKNKKLKIGANISLGYNF
ncbi:coiled-coil domain-containing protein [Oceanivirga salmonicida]|uniref:GA module-containing protein n=1 Tax=Oceanivirga salmonicida TaxID=1769291 RepID=UPI0018CC5B64|nr:GA module-containing protein [Oceanivirga salmonicida]